MTGRGRAKEQHPAPGDNELAGERTPRRPASRPAQVSLDPELCDFYLIAVVRDKKRSDGKIMAQFLWGDAGAAAIESETIFVDKDVALGCSVPVASPVAVQDVRDAVSASVSHNERSWQKRRASCPAGLPSWLLGSGVLIPDADTSSYQPFAGIPKPLTSAAPRLMLDDAWASYSLWPDSSHVPSRPEPTRFRGESCFSSSSNSSADSWSSSIASDFGFTLSAHFDLPAPQPHQAGPVTEPFQVPLGASFQASLSPRFDDAPALCNPSAPRHIRHRKLKAPKPLNLRQLLGHGEAEAEEGSSNPARSLTGSPVRESPLPKPSPQPLSLRQLLGYGGGEPDDEPSTMTPATPIRSPAREPCQPNPEPQPLSLRQLLEYGGGEPNEEPRRRPAKQSSCQEAMVPKALSLRQPLGYGGDEPDEEPSKMTPSTPTRSPVRESPQPKPKPKPKPLSLRQLLGYGGGEPDERSPSTPSPARTPTRESPSPRPLPQTEGRERRLLKQHPVSSERGRLASPGRVVSPPPPPAPVAALCGMRVKHGATGWF